MAEKRRTKWEEPEIVQGMKRQYCKCKVCGVPYFYDCIPYSLSSPILTTPCNHGIGSNDSALKTITRKEFMALKFPTPTKPTIKELDAEVTELRKTIKAYQDSDVLVRAEVTRLREVNAELLEACKFTLNQIDAWENFHTPLIPYTEVAKSSLVKVIRGRN